MSAFKTILQLFNILLAILEGLLFYLIFLHHRISSVTWLQGVCWLWWRKRMAPRQCGPLTRAPCSSPQLCLLLLSIWNSEPIPVSEKHRNSGNLTMFYCQTTNRTSHKWRENVHKRENQNKNNKSIVLTVQNSDGNKVDIEKLKAISCYCVEGKGHRTSSRVGEKIRKLQLAFYGESSISWLRQQTETG